MDVSPISFVRPVCALLHDIPDGVTGVAAVARRVVGHVPFCVGVTAPIIPVVRPRRLRPQSRRRLEES